MKGLKKVAAESRLMGRLWIYYDWNTDTVNARGQGDMVTLLVRPNTEAEIREAVERWKRA